MLENELATALLSAMIAHRPLRSSPAGRALAELLARRCAPGNEAAQHWETARCNCEPLPILTQLAGSLARQAVLDAELGADLERWLAEHPTQPEPAGNTLAGSARVYGPSVQARTIEGGIHFHHRDPSGAPAVPRQLRSVPAHFTDRSAELAALHRTLAAPRDERPLLAVLSGPGGVGKTALALRWLHAVADRYPDGQLYADLAPEPGEGPEPVEAVLGRFLRALGVAAEQVPADVGEAAATFRTLTADRRLALLLENAVSAAQVRALLPASPECAVVVTTRWRLAGLTMDGAAFLELDPLPAVYGGALLASTVGRSRVATESAAAADLVRLCAGLPLALSLVGARLAMRPQWPLARVVQELKDEGRRLRALAVEEISVLRVFDVSYDGLSAEAARAYRCLGLHPGPYCTLPAAAALLGLPEGEAAELLEELVDASLLAADEYGRYRFHDLVRLHARQQAEAVESAAERECVLRRLLEHQLRRAAAADRSVTPKDWHLGTVYREELPQPYERAADALADVEDDLPNAMAVLRACHRARIDDALVWQLAEALWSFFLHRKHFEDWSAAYRIGIEAAERCGDAAARSRMHHHLGFCLHNLRRPEETLEQGEYALAAAQEAADDRVEAEALSLMGMAYSFGGRPEEAADVLRRGVELDRRAGRTRGEARGRRRLGQALAAAGRLEDAIGELARGCELAAAIGDDQVRAMTQVWLADAHTRTGRPGTAAAMAEEAWALLADAGSHQYRAQALMVWGEAAEALGDPATARELLERSRDEYVAAGAPDLSRVDGALRRLGAAPSA